MLFGFAYFAVFGGFDTFVCIVFLGCLWLFMFEFGVLAILLIYWLFIQVESGLCAIGFDLILFYLF